MATLNFPFWIVTQRCGLISKPVEPDEMPGIIAAFSSAEKAASFMVSRGQTEWESRLAARSTLRGLMAELRQLGVQGFCLDPGKGCGSRIAFDELEKV